MEKATFANGCFWCTEAVFKRINGVASVTSGYAGGTIENPTYDQLHTENTGYAEALQVTYDPNVISYEQLLDIFFATHDPTTKDRQGYDVGSEYRSSIFCHSSEQKEKALAAIKKLEEKSTYKNPIVTEVVPYTTFYPATDEHKDYYDRNQGAPYCRIIIDPKIHKLMKQFASQVKEEYK